jgi:hypothetical protein
MSDVLMNLTWACFVCRMFWFQGMALNTLISGDSTMLCLFWVSVSPAIAPTPPVFVVGGVLGGFDGGGGL